MPERPALSAVFTGAIASLADRGVGAMVTGHPSGEQRMAQQRQAGRRAGRRAEAPIRHQEIEFRESGS